MGKDRPVEDIRLERAVVFVDPFTEAEEELKKKREEEIQAASLNSQGTSKKAKTEERKVFSSGVGKYINPTIKKEARKAESQPSAVSKKQKTKSSGFGDFSS